MEHLTDEHALAFVRGASTAEERARIEEHLDRCSDCREFLSVLAEACAESLAAVARSPLPCLGEHHQDDESLPDVDLATRFDFSDLVATGGMGHIHRARDRVTGRLVAVKTMRLGASSASRFAREARILARIEHPAVVRHVAHGTTKSGRAYLAMEWLEGEDLAQRLARGALSPRDALIVARGVAEGLAVVHEAGVVHRDVKPSNLFLAGGRLDAVRIIDFGVARWDEPMSEATNGGTLLGTPGYMAPEQVRRARAIGARADIFALGCVLYECLTGERAFGGADLLEVLTKVLLEAPHALRRAAPGVPRAVDRLVSAMLQKEPTRRPSAAEVARRLGALPLDGVPATVTVLGRRGQAAPSSARGRSIARGPVSTGDDWVRPRFAAVATVAALVALAVGARLTHGRAAHASAPPSGAAGGVAEAHSAAPPSATVSSSRARGEINVLLLGFDNSTGEAVLDGTLDSIFSAAVDRSDHVSSWSGSRLRVLKSELAAGNVADIPAQLAARDHTRVVAVRGAISARQSAYTIKVEAKDVAGHMLLSTERDSSARALVPTVGRLATDLLVALGEAAPVDDVRAERTNMSLDLDADREYDVGSELGLHGEYPGAIRHERVALSEDPSFLRARNALAVFLDDDGQVTSAKAEHRRVLEGIDSVDGTDRLRWLGQAQAALGNLPAARAAFTELLRNRPTDGVAEAGLTMMAITTEHYEEALSWAARAHEDHPRQVVLTGNLVQSLLGTDDYAAAAEVGSEVIGSNAHVPPEIFAAVADADVLLGRAAESEVAMSALEAEDGTMGAAVRADILVYEGRLEEAATVLEKATVDEEKSQDLAQASASRVSLAEIRQRQGMRAQALANINRGLDHAWLITQYRAVRLLLVMREESRARDVLAHLRRVADEDDQFYVKLLDGELLLERGRADEAAIAFRAAAALPGDEDTWLSHFAIGRAELAAGDAEAAKEELASCVRRRGAAVQASGLPTLRYASEATYYLARALESLNDPGARAMYAAVVAPASVRERDQLLDDARERAARMKE